LTVPHLDARDYWRAVILYGLNTATYKIALGSCLLDFAANGRSQVSMHDLAEAFFDTYRARLETDKPQLVLRNRLTVMERIIQRYRAGRLTREQAIDGVEQRAFRDVVPRFHTVDNRAVPAKFYEASPSGLVLTDELFGMSSEANSDELRQELGSRWDLLEAAFEMRRDADAALVNDIRQIYLARGYERTSVTPMRSVLGAYQQWECFYCREQMTATDSQVDHLLPRQLLYHDDAWNLVLAHRICNAQKSDALPPMKYVERLVNRNEDLIASNHPLKQKLLDQLGKSPAARRSYILSVYTDARRVIGYTWEGIRGFDPEDDQLYRAIVRSLSR
jgi:hypothetical protein